MKVRARRCTARTCAHQALMRAPLPSDASNDQAAPCRCLCAAGTVHPPASGPNFVSCTSAEGVQCWQGAGHAEQVRALHNAHRMRG